MNPILKLIGESEDFSEYEDILALDAEQDKSQFRRPVILTPEEALIEAKKLGKGNVPKYIEKIIARDPDASAQYAYNVLSERFPLGEPAIATSGYKSVSYARWALSTGDFVPGSKRFPPGEPAIVKNSHSVEMYVTYVLKQGDFVPGSKRWPAAEPVLAKNTEAALHYAMYTRERFPLGEPVIKRDRKSWKRYRDYFKDK